MPTAKLAALSGAAALVLAGCGNGVKPAAGTSTPAGKPISPGRVDDPRTSVSNHLKCIEQAHLQVVKVGQTGLQVGTPPSGPSVQFEPTPGAAQALQISGQAQAAEVIGSALLYPNQASDKELKTIENCLAKGVTG